MVSNIASELTKDAIELKRLDQIIVILILEGNIDEFAKKIKEFFDLKKRLKNLLLNKVRLKFSIIKHKRYSQK